MPFAVILDLDRHSAAALAPISEAVERADAMTPHRSTIAPHATLAVYDHLNAAAMTMVLRRFAEGLPAVPVRLSSLGLFPAASSVLFAAPVVSAEILALHRAYHEAAWPVIANCWAHYLPDQWVPHITLGEGLAAAVLGKVIADAVGAWRPIDGQLNALSLVRFHPAEVVWSTPLPAADP